MVRDRHLAEARSHAAALVRDARAQAREIIGKAQADAAALIGQAEQDGQVSADQDTSREWVAARRRAREIKLAAQRRAYEELQRAAVSRLESDARSHVLLGSVADAACRRLGPGSEVAVDARRVSATRERRHVTWTLERGVDESLASLGPQIEELWR